jgi:hypothetical protein
MRGLGALLIPNRRGVQDHGRGCEGLGQGQRDGVGVRGLALASLALAWAFAFACDAAGMV